FDDAGDDTELVKSRLPLHRNGCFIDCVQVSAVGYNHGWFGELIASRDELCQAELDPRRTKLIFGKPKSLAAIASRGFMVCWKFLRMPESSLALSPWSPSLDTQVELKNLTPPSDTFWLESGAWDLASFRRHLFWCLSTLAAISACPAAHLAESR